MTPIGRHEPVVVPSCTSVLADLYRLSKISIGLCFLDSPANSKIEIGSIIWRKIAVKATNSAIHDPPLRLSSAKVGVEMKTGAVVNKLRSLMPANPLELSRPKLDR